MDPRGASPVECVTYSTNYQQRLTLESWYTNSEKELLNRCQQLPAPYKRLIHDLKRNWQTNNRRIENNSKTTTDQSLQLSRLTTNHMTTKLTNPNEDQRHKYHHLMTTLHLTLKMTTAQVMETTVTKRSLSNEYLHRDDHAKQITDTSGFKPFPTTVFLISYQF